MEFSFNLNFQLSGDDANHDELVERLGAAGCDDAVVGIGQAGRIALEFIRDADHALAALTGAIADVQRAIPSAKLIEAGPDLVGLDDIADIAGVSRQYMRKLAVTQFATFPLPVHEGNSALWHLDEVLGWMQNRGGRVSWETGTLEVASAAKQVNLARYIRRVNPEMHRQLGRLIDSN